jgi:hypothetical protein
LVDEVDFLGDANWPTGANGTGNALVRLSPSRWGNDPASWEVRSPSPGAVDFALASVVDRHVFYNNSAFDGYDPRANAADDAAIAVDKQALLPGQAASFANYTSYSRGINGIMVDIAAAAHPDQITAADFVFRVGNDDRPADWVAAPQPTSVVVRPLAGRDGSDRVTIVWSDNAIRRQWLQVTVLATPNTGLTAADVFYYGNAVGETGNSAADARVDAADMLAVRSHFRSFRDPATIDDPHDLNRDGRVDATDLLLARNNQTGLATSLKMITIPGGKSPGAAGKSRTPAKLARPRM